MFFYKERTWVSSVVIAIITLTVQFPGFAIFPGIAKDIELFLYVNTAKAGFMLLLGMIVNLLLLALAYKMQSGKRGDLLQMIEV